MRNACLKALALALTVISWAATSNRAQAQLVQTHIQFTNTWKYLQTGVEQGTAWRTNGFNDSAWEGPSRGLLGNEPGSPNLYEIHAPITTPLSISGGLPATYYFRTTFNFSGNTNGISIFTTNLVDDGCLIYLNGRLAGNVRMAGANYTAASFSGAGPTTEGQLDVVPLSNFLRTGLNTIAVEVHQQGAGSSDIMFGMKLVTISPQSLTITNQPDSQTVSAGDPVTFTVGVSGGPAVYRWQKDGVNLTSTSDTLVIANAQLANAGNYRVIITNTINSVTSAVAVLTVTSDTDGPKVTEVIVDNGFGSNSVNIKFDESLTTASARNTNNYRLVPVSNTNISIRVTNILYSSALGALLQISTTDVNWDPRGQYFVVINGVADSKSNNIAPYTRVPASIQITTNLAQMSDKWFEHHNMAFDPAIYDNTSPSTSWFGTNYVVDLNAGLWTAGGIGGIYYFDPDSVGQLCAGDSFGELIGFQNNPTLFRRTFTLPPGLGTNGVFRLRFIVDDGMVLYLNGAEILTSAGIPYRFNMPAGPLTKNSKALVDQSPAACVTNISIPVKNLRAGVNVLAAAVHQSAAANSDTIFGLEMDAIFLSTPTMPIQEPPTNQLRLSYSYTKNNRQLVMSWPTNFSGFSLVSKSTIGATNSNPQWIQVSDQSNPYTNSLPTSSHRFFEIKKL